MSLTPSLGVGFTVDKGEALGQVWVMVSHPREGSEDRLPALEDHLLVASEVAVA
jgi:hypothetical protein